MTHLAASSDISTKASIGQGTSVWHLAQVREDARIGRECVIGRGAYIGVGVHVGDRVKIQNLAQIYEPAVIEDGVFIGPAVVLTNDQYPRAVKADGAPVAASDWQPVGVTVRHGASIGARAVCVAPIEIGAWSMVGAGAIVVNDVPAYGLVVGSPARQIGWVGPAGRRLTPVSPGRWRCPATGAAFVEVGDALEEVNDD